MKDYVTLKMAAKNSAITGILKCIKMKTVILNYNISHYYCFIFDYRNASSVSKRDVLQKYFKILPTPVVSW